MKYIFLIVAIVLFSLSACSSAKPQVNVQEKALPSWYTKPSVSNSTDLYALGEGESKKEAIAEALSLMASTLSISISSKYNAKTEVHEGRVNSADGIYKSDIQSDVKQIRISNYELLHAQSLGFKRYAVLVKANKHKLFIGMKHELDQQFALIKSEAKALEQTDAITKLAFYRKKTESLKNTPNTLIVMNVLNPTFEGDLYIREIQEISIAYHSLLQNISFSIVTSKDAQNLATPLAKGLSEKRLMIKESHSSQHFTIYVKNSMKKAKAYGFTLARSEISILTKDSKGVVVGSNAMNIVGQSSQGFAIAKQNVAVRLRILIVKEGIAKVLGLDI